MTLLKRKVVHHTLYDVWKLVDTMVWAQVNEQVYIQGLLILRNHIADEIKEMTS